MNRTISLLVAALLAAFTLPPELLAQSTNVRPRNINQNTRGKSGIFKGSGNLIQSNATASFIGGGQSNTVTINSTNAVIGGGFGNSVANLFGSIAGGMSNTASGDFSVVGAGLRNTANSRSATVAGGEANTAGSAAATVGGGEANDASGEGSTIAGGWRNTAGFRATVGGGAENAAIGEFAVVGGGLQNTNEGTNSTIGGGGTNFATGLAATVSGGGRNTVNGNYATIAGGEANSAVGEHSTVPGGHLGVADHRGAFVWSGVGGGGTMTMSTNEYSFTVRAPGGVRFISTFVNSTTITPVPGGLDGVFLAPNSGSWASLSDSNAKTRITSIKPREILSKLMALPVTEWEYKSDPDGRRYIGPMAQDFHTAFGLGYDDKSISTLDSDGVMYAAIQGLVEELKDRDKTIEELKAKSAEVETLKAQNAEVQTELRAIREQLSKLPPQ